MDRNILKASNGDAINAVLAAADYNFRKLIAWLRRIWHAFLALIATSLDPPAKPIVA